VFLRDRLEDVFLPSLTDRMKLFDSLFKKKKKKKKKKIMIRSRSRDRFCSRSNKGTRGVLWRESRFFFEAKCDCNRKS